MIHLVTGGARAGKSGFVLAQAEATDAPSIAFVATAERGDDEMIERIARHQAERSPRWVTVEEPLDLERVLPSLPHAAIVVDCLTLWVSNLMFHPAAGDDPERRIDALVDALGRVRVPTWLVTNEVGLGIVPADPVSRRYRDLLGRCNQRVAAAADHVTFVVSGLPMKLK
ncbi:MAG: bifunctional adenosylcobinamide kinase/adenosylcobinamide-phosphate guanylyltransferase [Pseudomonadota bacterium]|nr:bifunctional adenosylcobinamide kinase/adenosylcobinamide-phosphate guanylyltransferase [Pseudomonadota bacterium]